MPPSSLIARLPTARWESCSSPSLTIARLSSSGQTDPRLTIGQAKNAVALLGFTPDWFACQAVLYSLGQDLAVRFRDWTWKKVSITCSCYGSVCSSGLFAVRQQLTCLASKNKLLCRLGTVLLRIYHWQEASDTFLAGLQLAPSNSELVGSRLYYDLEQVLHKAVSSVQAPEDDVPDCLQRASASA